MQGPSWDPQEQRGTTFRAFCKELAAQSQGKGGYELFAQFSEYVAAELKIKSSFYDDENRRTTEKFLIHSKTTVFRKRKLIQYPFKFT